MVSFTLIAGTAVLIQEVVAGAAAGLGRGLLGWATKRDPGEQINYRKLGRTVVIFTTAGIAVALAGDPLTGGNIVAATGTTAVLGVIFDDVYSRFTRPRRENTKG